MNKYFLLSCISLVCLFAYSTIEVQASTSDGTILESYTLTKVCASTDCTSFSTVNMKPTLNAETNGATAIEITDTAIKGYAWGDQIGWINFQPSGYGVSVNATTGVLSGYAYAGVGSWINFAPTTAPGGTTVGVTIDINGQFSGWAYVSGIYGGWLKFDCTTASTCIKTDWRPLSARSSTSPTPTSSASPGSGSGASSSSGGRATPASGLPPLGPGSSGEADHLPTSNLVPNSGEQAPGAPQVSPATGSGDHTLGQTGSQASSTHLTQSSSHSGSASKQSAFVWILEVILVIILVGLVIRLIL